MYLYKRYADHMKVFEMAKDNYSDLIKTLQLTRKYIGVGIMERNQPIQNNEYDLLMDAKLIVVYSFIELFEGKERVEVQNYCTCYYENNPPCLFCLKKSKPKKVHFEERIKKKLENDGKKFLGVEDGYVFYTNTDGIIYGEAEQYFEEKTEDDHYENDNDYG